MSTDAGDDGTTDEQARAILEKVLDPDGTARNTRREINELLASPWFRAIAPELVAEIGPELIERSARMERDLDVQIRASREFSARGWAISSSSRTKDYDRALAALDAGDDERAEQLLVELHARDEWRFTRPADQIRMMAAPDAERERQKYGARADLLYRACEHHRAGAYEASVPIVLAQIEGLTADVTGGRLFFSTDERRRAAIVENDSLATLSWSLPVVRAAFSTGQHETVVHSRGLSRHGILHGRDLGYGTELVSTKCFVLLAAVVEWAQVELRRQGEQRRRDDEIRYRGSDEVDPSGARLDRREFSATRAALRGLYFNQLGWGQRRGGYNPELVELMSSNFDWAGLPPQHGIRMVVTPDQRHWWAWRRTITGWCFGIGASRDLAEHPWYFDGPEPPPGGPHEVSDLWVSELDPRPSPNWRG